ncbi:Lysozyme [Neolecta irregularis DAH-3]|uniref:Lysozyme n=1 Tax=Neolecta irregularis (strain DAH-3) TaxID=1198029 RepID=A0A1U7LKS1_NEOID|nr:Lysozyme [Neolecta irregularis DAH-3]|eukprot:OLL23256.1 Lysozyme [Neolecta irregularis DAH-3]
MRFLLCLLALFFTLTTADSNASSLNCTQEVTVKQGETVTIITAALGLTNSHDEFTSLNPTVPDWNNIIPGQVLNFPCSSPAPVVTPSICTQNYTVQQNDNVFSIHQLFRIPIDQLLFSLLNPTVHNWKFVSVGQVINLPCSPCLQGYKVKHGDGVIAIAESRYVAINEFDFYVYNPDVKNWNFITPDELIYLPCSPCRQKYTAVQGDTVLNIANTLGVFIHEQLFLSMNKGIKDWGSILAGQVLYFPCS